VEWCTYSWSGHSAAHTAASYVWSSVYSNQGGQDGKREETHINTESDRVAHVRSDILQQILFALGQSLSVQCLRH
jgi:hypothetical protein